jgi:hypothetical protein
LWLGAKEPPRHSPNTAICTQKNAIARPGGIRRARTTTYDVRRPATKDISTPASSADRPTLLWLAPSDPLERTVEAGLVPAQKEFLTNHVHAHLDVFIDGKAILVPAGIGINTRSSRSRSSDRG